MLRKTKTKANQKRVKGTKKAQNGGLYNKLYGSNYDPVNNSLRKVIDTSFKRLITSTALIATKSPLLLTTTGVFIIESVVQTLPLFLRLIIAIGLLPVSLMGYLAIRLYNGFNSIARKGIVNMLNKFVKGTNVPRISYPHIWSDVNESNNIDLIFGLQERRQWLEKNPLPESLFFNETDAKKDIKFQEELKNEFVKDFQSNINKSSTEDKTEFSKIAKMKNLFHDLISLLWTRKKSLPSS